jgi:hypothetical protein
MAGSTVFFFAELSGSDADDGTRDARDGHRRARHR